MIDIILISNGSIYKRTNKPFSFRLFSCLQKTHYGGLTLQNDIYSNIKDPDALKSFFECITSCSINTEGVDWTTACYVKYLKPKNIDYPLRFS